MKRVLLFLLLATVARAATYNLTSADRDTVNTAIQNSVNGDTINLPANQSVTWTSALTAFTKGITLNFNGCTITRNYTTNNVSMIRGTAVNGFNLRITGGTFTGALNGNGATARYLRVDSVNNGNVRVDNCTFGASGHTSVETFYQGAGQILIDTCTFYANEPDEIIHNMGWGAGSLAGWDDTIVEGSLNAVYIEDCTFIWQGDPTETGANAAMQMYYGARTVFRYNEIHGALWDCHGEPTPHAGRWYEIYENDWYISTNTSRLFQLRGGSGVIFNNRLHNLPGALGGRNILFWNEVAGNPAPCQVGRGKNTTAGSHSSQASAPIYVWGNTVINAGGGTLGMQFEDQYTGSATAGSIQSPRDYIWGIDKRTLAENPYTAATYPHPMRGAAPPVETVAQPVIAPAAGSYYTAQTISMQTPTSGASYYYTLDGSDPASSGTRILYTASFSLSVDATVRAIGIKSGVTNSPPASSAFDFSPWSVTGANVWKTFAVPQQTGPFTLAFRVRTNSAVSDSVVGLGAAPIASNANLEANLLFSINSVVQVRDGGSYVGSYPYQADTDYDISMVIDPSASTNQIQSVSITPAGGSTTVLGTNFDFRNGAAATELDNFGFRAGSAVVSVTVSNLTLTPAATPAGTYYVSKDTGNNANPGTLASPWQTIEYALSQISGGDTIIVRGATTAYTLSGTTLVITGDSGTPTQYTTLKAYPGERPAIEGQGNTGRIAFGTLPPAAPVETSYWRIEGFEISNFNHLLAIRNGAHHIEVVGNFFHHSGDQILNAYYNVHDILIEGNTFEDGGAIGTFNGEAMYIGSHLGMFDSNPAFPDSTYNITIKGNIIDRMEHEGIDIKHNVLNVLIEDNVISNCVVNFTYGKWSILVNPSTVGNPNHIIRRNWISGQGGLTEAAAIGVATGAQVYNNVVYNTASPAYAVSIIPGDAHIRYVWNNTLDIESSKAIFFSGGTYSVGNNIGPPTSGSNRAFNSADFVNAGIHNYQLVAGIAGTSPPFTISDDFDEVQRGVPPDIGAFEFTGVAPDITAPIPNPSTFEVAPAATGPNAITMTATEASDATSPPAQYYFEETTGHAGATDSGWQASPVYIDSGLSPNTAYSYYVWTRDALLNQGSPSTVQSATTPPVISQGAANCDTLNVTTLRVGP